MHSGHRAGRGVHSRILQGVLAGREEQTTATATRGRRRTAAGTTFAPQVRTRKYPPPTNLHTKTDQPTGPPQPGGEGDIRPRLSSPRQQAVLAVPPLPDCHSARARLRGALAGGGGSGCGGGGQVRQLFSPAAHTPFLHLTQDAPDTYRQALDNTPLRVRYPRYIHLLRTHVSLREDTSYIDTMCLTGKRDMCVCDMCVCDLGNASSGYVDLAPKLRAERASRADATGERRTPLRTSVSQTLCKIHAIYM